MSLMDPASAGAGACAIIRLFHYEPGAWQSPGALRGYEIAEKLGVGGMGVVYKARDTRLDRTVAVKVLSADVASDRDQRLRFEREGRAISQLNHPHICTLYDVGNFKGTEFLVMECLEGVTLADRLDRGRLPHAEVVTIARQILAALDAAHQRGIVHRDLKPANVMLTANGAKLLDLGLAKLRQTGAEASSLLDDRVDVPPGGFPAGANLPATGEQFVGLLYDDQRPLARVIYLEL